MSEEQACLLIKGIKVPQSLGENRRSERKVDTSIHRLEWKGHLKGNFGLCSFVNKG